VNGPDANESIQRDRILANYLKVSSIKGDNRQLVKRFLLGSIWAAVLTPLLFYLKFGSVGWFAIGFTVFLVVLCWLFALGLFFQTRTDYHTNVPMERSLADRIGAFWLVACAFGPFFGWIVTAIPPTEASWKWQYLGRAFLAVILPVITAVPLVPYARGKSALIAVPLLLAVTALPILSCLWVLADLNDGPQTVQVKVLDVGSDRTRHCQVLEGVTSDPPCEELRPVLTGEYYDVRWLPHTRRVLSKEKFLIKSEAYGLTRSRRTTRTPVRQFSLISKR
jgi:hypothetical protein